MLSLLVFSSAVGQDVSKDKYVKLSQDLLETILKRESAEQFITAYQNIDLDQLASSLNNNEKQLAFWINTYNAFIVCLVLI